MSNTNGAVGAIIVAAGKGSRMGLGYNKVFAPLCGKPVIQWTLEQFTKSGLIDYAVLVISPCDEQIINDILQSLNNINDNNSISKQTVITYCFGGKDRQDSVYNGLKAIDEKVETVLIHDGARPFADRLLIERSIIGAQKYGGACAGMPVKDTIKIINDENFITSTPERKFVWCAQTPQAFSKEIILDAHNKANLKGIKGTDDAAIAEAAGYKVIMFEGSYQNIKLTSHEDIIIAEQLIKRVEIQ